MKADVLRRLDIAQALVCTSEPPPHDYQSLKDNIVRTELAQEVELLRALFEQDSEIEEKFKTRCLQRSQLLEGTSLSYFEMPEGACNRLYWDIAMLLFSPRTMQNMLAILVPELTNVLDIELEGRASNPRNLRIILNLTEMSYLDASVPPMIEDLGHYAVRNKTILDARKIERFNFPLHQQCYELMHRNYPDLAIALYQHNPHLKRLGEDILTCSGTGCSIAQRIRDFILILRLGGLHMTGRQFASIAAQQAFTDFLEYLASLPEDTQATLNTLQSKQLGSHNFAAVISGLKGSNCVETAASYLQVIIDEPENATFLNTHPHLPQTYLERIHQQYQPKKILPTIAQSYNCQMPKEYLLNALKTITIHSPSDWINLLLNFPLEFYKDLLAYATITTIPLIPDELIHMMSNGVFNQAQQDALNQSFLTSYEKFNLDLSFMKYAIKSKNPLLLSFIKNLSDPDRLKLFSPKDSLGSNILHLVAAHPESLKIALGLLPESNRLAAVQQKSDYGRTVLHRAAQHPDSLRMVLALYPEREQPSAVKQITELGNTVFHHAAPAPNSLKMVLELLPEEERTEALMQKNNEMQSVLHWVLHTAPNSLRIILDLLPKRDRISVIYRLLYAVTHNLTLLKSAFKALPEAELLSALQLETYEVTLLDFIIKNDGDDQSQPRLKELWTTLSTEARGQLKVSVSKKINAYFYFNCLATFSAISPALLGVYLYSQFPPDDLGPFMLMGTSAGLFLCNNHYQFFSRQRAPRSEEVLAAINRVEMNI